LLQAVRMESISTRQSKMLNMRFIIPVILRFYFVKIIQQKPSVFKNTEGF